jgi:hypothetical protein
MIYIDTKPGPTLRRADLAAIIKALLLARSEPAWRKALLTLAVGCDLEVVLSQSSEPPCPAVTWDGTE